MDPRRASKSHLVHFFKQMLISRHLQGHFFNICPTFLSLQGNLFKLRRTSLQLRPRIKWDIDFNIDIGFNRAFGSTATSNSTSSRIDCSIVLWGKTRLHCNIDPLQRIDVITATRSLTTTRIDCNIAMWGNTFPSTPLQRCDMGDNSLPLHFRFQSQSRSAGPSHHRVQP